jgi:Replication-relaxation
MPNRIQRTFAGGRLGGRTLVRPIGSLMSPSIGRLAPERLVPGRYAQIDGSARLVLREVRPSSSARSAVRLGPRDIALAQALDQYRYLDTRQVRWLFFSTERKARAGLQQLAGRGTIRSWRATLQPGRVNRPTVHLLTPAGARELARRRGEDSRPAVKRASHAAERIWNLVHDLDANGFFVSLAAASRDRGDEGLYHWLGPTACRLVSKRERVPPSDGWGRYLVADGELRIYLEWDRGTEHADRLGAMAAAYTSYFAGRRDADRRHVLVVVPTDAREREIQRVLGRALGGADSTCRVWTTSVDALRAEGALGSVWLEAGHTRTRRRLNELPASARPELAIANCIGKPTWWERRPAGGEGA